VTSSCQPPAAVAILLSSSVTHCDTDSLAQQVDVKMLPGESNCEFIPENNTGDEDDKGNEHPAI
jgi:hypothetical protein